ncbi:MAG: hypothetical protein AAF824_06080 [Bacteroidota bacterium]
MMKVIRVFLSLSALAFLVSCTDDPFDDAGSQSRIFIHVINAYANADAVDISITAFNNEQKIASNLSIGSSWPQSGYASLLTDPNAVGTDTSSQDVGGLLIQVDDHNTGTRLIEPEFLAMRPNTRSTLVLLDSAGLPILVKAFDSYSQISTEDPNVRFMNLNNFTRSVSLVPDNSAPRINSLNFLNYSRFFQYPEQQYTFFVEDDFTGEVLDTIPDVILEPGKRYNFFLTHKEGTPLAGFAVLNLEEDE